MPDRPPSAPEKVSPLQVAVHLAIGALLGTLGAIFLIVCDASGVHHLLAAGAAPPTPVAAFVALCACTVAIGASLTGVIFSAMEAERIAASRRRPPHGRT
jgi:hypothetical protein